MELDELTGPITEMVISWKHGDIETGHLLFRKMIVLLEHAAQRYASQAVGQTAGDAVNGAYLIIKRADPTLFDSRGSFFALYVEAMDFWLKEQRRLRATQKRRGDPLPLLGEPRSSEPRPLMKLLVEMNEALEHLQETGRICAQDAQIFMANKIFGVAQFDLADIYGISRDKIGAIARDVEKILYEAFGAPTETPR